jgi:hypothetical protein
MKAFKAGEYALPGATPANPITGESSGARRRPPAWPSPTDPPSPPATLLPPARQPLRRRPVRLLSPCRCPASRPKKKITTKAVQESEGLPPPSLATLPPAKPEDEGDAPWDKEGLTFKQRAFVKAFVGPAAGNATKAAAMAGYSDSNRNVLAVTGWETLRKPNVQRAIARAMAEREGGPEWTRAGVVEIARSSASDYLTFDTDEKGNRIPRPDLIAAAEAGALGTIKKIKFDGETGGIVQIEGYDRSPR